VQNEHVHQAEDIAAGSRALGISAIELRAWSPYHFFTRQPAGKFTIYLNRSIVSECKGFERVKEALERATGARMNGVDPSGQFGLFETACIGLSDLEPAALIDLYPFTNLNSLRVKEIVAHLKQGAAPASICDIVPDHIRSVPSGDKAVLLRDYDHGKAVLPLKNHSPQSIIEEIKKSGLRGMGGASDRLKWSCAAKNRQPEVHRLQRG
jgi:[NiFe] hydrogenase diaphorase moiety large subunit